MTDDVRFSARLTHDGEFVALLIPVRELPRTLQARPTRMQLRVIPQSRLSTTTEVDAPTYVLALDARLRQAPSTPGKTHSSTQD